MNFGQALAALITGGRVGSEALARPGAYLALQQPAGIITEPFIALNLSNGVCIPWTPTQEAILATNWIAIVEENHAMQGMREHAQTSR